MAVVVNNKDPNDPNNQPQPGMAQPTSGVQGSNVMASGTSPQGAPQPVSSGRFTNLQRYMTANQGAGQNIANNINNKVNQNATDTQNAVSGAAQGFKSQLDAEKQRLAQASGFAQQVNTDPNQIANNDQQFQDFTKLRTGENNLGTIQQTGQQNLDAANSKLNTFQQQAAMVGNEKGRFELLRESLGRPNYTTGQQRLDQLLLQGGGGGILDNLQRSAAQKAQDLQNQYTGATNDFTSGLTDAQKQVLDAQKTVSGALGRIDDPTTLANEGSGAIGGLNQTLQQQLATQQDKATSDYNTYMGRLTNKQLNMDDANHLALMLNPDADLDKDGKHTGQVQDFNKVNTFGLDPAQMTEFFKKGQYNVSNTATVDQLNRAKALAKLTGGQGLSDIGMNLDENQIGKMDPTLIDNTPAVAEFAARQQPYQTQAATLTQARDQNRFQEDKMRADGTLDKYNKQLNSALTSNDPTALRHVLEAMQKDPEISGALGSGNMNTDTQGVGAWAGTGQNTLIPEYVSRAMGAQLNPLGGLRGWNDTGERLEGLAKRTPAKEFGLGGYFATQGLDANRNAAQEQLDDLKKNTGFGSLQDLLDKQYADDYKKRSIDPYQKYVDDLKEIGGRTPGQVIDPIGSAPYIDPKTGKTITPGAGYKK
jgi:hypothetical protein